MKVPTIETKIMPAEAGDLMAVLVVGNPTVEFGSEVNVEVNGAVRAYYYDKFVHGIDTLPLNELSPEVLSLFGYPDPDLLLRILTHTYGTGIPSDVLVTIYTVSSVPVEISGEEVEA